jgi:hypothetical protein
MTRKQMCRSTGSVKVRNIPTYETNWYALWAFNAIVFPNNFPSRRKTKGYLRNTTTLKTYDI